MRDSDHERLASALEARLAEAASFCEGAQLAPSTTRARLATLDRLFRAVPRLDQHGITSWVDSRKNGRTGKPLGPHGKNAYILAAKWYLARTELVPGAAATAASLSRHPVPASPGQSIEPGVFEDIVQFSPTSRHELAFRLVYECGFRPHEVLSIRACDVLDGRAAATTPSTGEGEAAGGMAWVHLPEANPVTPSGRNKTGERLVPVYKGVHRLLALRDATREASGPDARLFPWAHRHLSTTFYRMKQRHAGDRAGGPAGAVDRGPGATAPRGAANRAPCPPLAPVRLYDLRHSAITALYLTELPDQVIRKVVGWTPSSRMPDVYVHVTQVHIQQAFERISSPVAPQPRGAPPAPLRHGTGRPLGWR